MSRCIQRSRGRSASGDLKSRLQGELAAPCIFPSLLCPLTLMCLTNRPCDVAWTKAARAGRRLRRNVDFGLRTGASPFTRSHAAAGTTCTGRLHPHVRREFVTVRTSPRCRFWGCARQALGDRVRAPSQQRLGQVFFQGPFQPGLFCGSRCYLVIILINVDQMINGNSDI